MDASELMEWTATLIAMEDEQASLVAAGEWRSGPRTLLAALGLARREVVLTAGLAWLLDPSGHHGLGVGVLNGVRTHLGLEPWQGQHIAVTREHAGAFSRADIVLRSAQDTVVIEAKVDAPEGDRQLTRLEQDWNVGSVTVFVFLTPGLRQPSTASDPSRWQAMTWGDVAQIIALAIEQARSVAPGAVDYKRTLEEYLDA